MVLHSGLLVSVTVAAVVVATFSQQLENGKIYAIQSANDGTYLQALSNGKLCERLSDVISSTNLSPNSEAFRWRSSIFNDNVWLQIDASFGELLRNELTMDNTPPFCFVVFADYEVVPVMENASLIKNKRSAKCLKANGVGQRISWDRCQNDQRSQFWNFIDLSH